MSLHPARFSSRANSPRVQFSCLKKSSSIETKPYDTTANLEESKGWGRWRLGRRGNYTCVGGSGTPLKSFGYFLPDLTSRCAHLMPFQLPQTVPQPQRQREGGITVGRRGAAARGEATRRAGERGRTGSQPPDTGPIRASSPSPAALPPYWSAVGRLVTAHPLLVGERGTGFPPPTSPGHDAPPHLPENHFFEK